MQARLRKSLVVPLLACLGAPAAAGDCPLPADMITGLRIAYADGTETEVRHAGVGLVETREPGRAEGGGDLRFLSAYGLYDIEAGALTGDAPSPERQVTYAYDPPEFVTPADGAAGWTGTVAVHFPDGGRDEQTAAYVFGSEATLTLEGCSFRTLPVDATFVRADGWEGQKFLYFPDFGFAVLTGRSGPGTEPVSYSLSALAASGQ